MPGQSNKKLVPITMCERRCDRGCCSIKTIPLRVCKGLTGHKVQGMSIGEGEQFKNAQIHMPQGMMKNTPGWVLTAFTRLKNSNDCAIATKSRDMSKSEILRIGNTKAYKTRREFRNKMAQKSGRTIRRTIERITALHSVEEGEEPTFEGGCKFLLRWYRTEFPIE